jgi:hypothetical protein
MSDADLGGKTLWTLIPVGALYGVLSILVFRRFSERLAVRRSVNRVWAHVMELGLFLDSPALVLRAQRDLLLENLRLLRLVILPAGILALLFVFLFPPLNALYGHAPLPVGEPSVVTIQMKDSALPSVQLVAPPGMVIETPGVRILHDHQISWRVRPLQPTSGDLKFRFKDVRSIHIHYPKATILSLPWLAWFAISSSLSAVIFGLCWKR